MGRWLLAMDAMKGVYDMTTGTFTEHDTQTFATKLDAFSRTLTTGEQAVLTLIEQQLGTLVTAETEDDVQGYMIDLSDVAMIRQREMLHEADRLRPGVRAGYDVESEQPESRARLWQRIAITLGRQATAMAPLPTREPATG